MERKRIKAIQSTEEATDIGGIQTPIGGFTRRKQVIANPVTEEDSPEREKPTKAGKTFLVFRLGKENTVLENSNAADLLGEQHFLNMYQDKLDKGQFLTLFRVTNLAGKFSDYKSYNGTTERDHVPNPEGELIGRVPPYSGANFFWYSFPLNGAWEAERLETIPLKKIQELAEKKLAKIGYHKYDFTFADAIMKLFKKYK